jgi:hypothetical protein
VLQCLKAGDLVTWDPNGNGYYVFPRNKWYVESGKYDERNAGGGLGQWDRDHHYDVWGKVRDTLAGLYCLSATANNSTIDAALHVRQARHPVPAPWLRFLGHRWRRLRTRSACMLDFAAFLSGLGLRAASCNGG